MTVRAEQIEKLQQELRQLLSLSYTAARTSMDSRAPKAMTAPSSGPDDLRTGLEALAASGESTYEELQRLQRTLSRQSFRGAESARRLVRRLSRRTRQSVDSLHALSLRLQHMPGSAASGPPVLTRGDDEGHPGHKDPVH